jgi:hypothetical protein
LGSFVPALNRSAAGRVLLVGLSVWCCRAARGADVPAPIPWAYSAYFGTGVYEVDNGETSYIIRAAPSWGIRESSFDEQGHRMIGWRFRVPIALGLHDFDTSELGTTLKLKNVSTLTAVPGVEFDIPMTKRWTLRPFGAFGYGAQLDGSSSAWVYWAGVKSRFQFSADGFDWSIVNALTYSGYTTAHDNVATSDVHTSSRVLPLLTAFEFDRPIEKKIGDEPVHLYWTFGYTNYLADQPLLVGSAVSSIHIGDEWELGMAFGRGKQPFKLWLFSWDRVGIAYRFSSDHRFQGISLSFSSIFDR